MLQTSQDVDLCYNLLAISVRHSVKLQLLASKDLSVADSFHLANQPKGARANDFEWFICKKGECA